MTLVALDIGGSKVALAVETEDGRSWRGAQPLPDRAPPEEDWERLATLLLDRLSGTPPVDGVGVSAAPTLDRAGRVARWPQRPQWEGLDLAARLHRLAGAPPRCEDDGAAAALAEACAWSCADLVYMGVGSGIGGGIVAGGRLYRGAHGTAAELGHVVVAGATTPAPPCACGRAGCLQAIASGRAVLARAAQLGGPVLDRLDGPALGAALAAGVPWAVRAVEPAVEAVALAVVGLVEVVDPKRVVLGGGVGAGLPRFVERVAERVTRLRRRGQVLPHLSRAAHGTGSSLAGAIHLARLARAGAPEEP